MIKEVYVNVGVIADTKGEWMPLRIYWEDGRVFEVEKVTEVREVESIVNGCSGKRYEIVIKGNRKFLFYKEPRWFVEGK